MSNQVPDRQVDRSALRVNQAFIVGLLALGFVLNLPALVGLVSLVMLLGTAAPRLALFQQTYRYLLRPAGIVRPAVVLDNPEPHRFAQGLGGAVAGLGLLALLLGAPVVGWALAWVVIVLAALNLFVGFCAGYFVYYQLNRFGVPGFRYRPVRR